MNKTVYTTIATSGILTNYNTLKNAYDACINSLNAEDKITRITSKNFSTYDHSPMPTNDVCF